MKQITATDRKADIPLNPFGDHGDTTIFGRANNVADKGIAHYFVGTATRAVSQARSIESGLLPDTTNQILRESGFQAYHFIRKFSRPEAKACVFSGDINLPLAASQDEYFEQIINLKRINDIRRINKFFETVNHNLKKGGIFIGKVETYLQKKSRIMAAYPVGINITVYAIYYLVHRVIPKLPYTKQLFYITTRGNNRVLSKAETYGRLYSCGFELVGEASVNGFNYFACQKVKEPVYDTHPTYGMFIRLKRIGKGGNIFNVYKLRTMHAYSEYLQQYVYDKNSLDDRGKLKDDFRVTTVGKVIRKYWIDELPMLINVFLKRNMKIVGVRPLSEHYFSLYSDELKAKRIQFKPGLIPPYYAQYPTPQTLGEIEQNETDYLNAYEKRPFLTDLRYGIRALGNIFLRKARSK